MNPSVGANQQQAQIMQKLMLWVFPLFVLFGGPFFPIAILLYWLSNNTWTLGQQYFIYHRIDREEAAKKAAAAAKAEQSRKDLSPKPGQRPAKKKGPQPGQHGPAGTTPPSAPSGGAGDAARSRPATGGAKKKNKKRR